MFIHVLIFKLFSWFCESVPRFTEDLNICLIFVPECAERFFFSTYVLLKDLLHANWNTAATGTFVNKQYCWHLWRGILVYAFAHRRIFNF